MTVELLPGSRSGIAEAPPSKSYAHRLLIAAALSDCGCVVGNTGTSDDIEATSECLSGLGAEIIRLPGGAAEVKPVSGNKAFPGNKQITVNARESGSTLRFLLPVAGALGANVTFKMEGRLPERPMDDYIDSLKKGGMEIVKEGAELRCSGRLVPGTYEIPGNVSSQYISGLLFALPLLEGDSRILIKGKTESKAYAGMTAEVLGLFKANIEKIDGGYVIGGGRGLKSPENRMLVTEGDYSGAAFLLAAGAFSKKGVAVSGLNPDSGQGDRKIADILERFGAKVEKSGSLIKVSQSEMKGTVIDAQEIPDLVPVLATAACGAAGETRIINAARLRFKETDRLKTTAELINTLGGKAEETPDGLIIQGREVTGGLTGGSCESFSDHRIAMAAALASCIAKTKISINGAECVRKSVPGFFGVFGKLEIEN